MEEKSPFRPTASGLTRLPNVPDSGDVIPGMAYYAGSGPAGERCANCMYWGYFRPNKTETRSYKTSACLRLKELTGKHRPPIKGETSACKYFRR